MAYGMMGGGMMGGYGGGLYFGYGWIVQLLILLLVILVFWWLLRGARFGYAANAKETPLEIVKRRYAAGEIDKKEYARLKKELGD